MNILDYEDVDEVIIWCNSDEEAALLLKHLEEKGFKWGSGHLPTEWGRAIRISPSAYNIDINHRQLFCCTKNLEPDGLFVALTFEEFCGFTSEVCDDIEASEDLLQFLAGLCGK